MDPQTKTPENTPPPPPPPSESLDAAQPATVTTTDATSPSDADQAPLPPSKKPNKLKGFFGRFNVYMLGFLVVVLIAVGILVFAALKSKSAPQDNIASQNLSQDSLKQLANSDVTVGDSKQVLNVQSNAVFAAKVLVRGGLEVAGPIQVGGALSLPGITVSGISMFDQAQINKTLSVGGDTSIQGQLTVQKGLIVSGNGTFSGNISTPQVTTTNLQLGGDLNLTHHLAIGGSTPGRSNGAALGSGGTTSVSGSDGAGNVSINTGGGPAAGCFVTVTFAQKYNQTPRVLITPVGSAAAEIQYYVNRTTTSFSICTINPAPASSSFGFDYFVVG